MSKKCWSCGEEDTSLICKACGKVQPVSSLSSFERFGFTPHPAIDFSALREKYLAMQAMFHPDRFVLKSKEEQFFAREQSEALNNAFIVLKDPIQSLEELLGNKKEGSDDPDFLVEMMELQEKIEEVSTKEEVLNLKEIIEKEKKDLLRECIQFFEKNQKTSLLSAFRKLQYFEKTLKALMNKSMDFL